MSIKEITEHIYELFKRNANNLEDVSVIQHNNKDTIKLITTRSRVITIRVSEDEENDL